MKNSSIKDKFSSNLKHFKKYYLDYYLVKKDL